MALKIKKQVQKSYRWDSGENSFHLNTVGEVPTMLSMKLEGHETLVVYEVDNIKMIKQFFNELEMEWEI